MAPKNAPKRLQGGMAPENALDKLGDDVYRGCLDGLVIDLRSMDLDKHMHMLRKTPFRHLFEAIHNNTLEPSVCKRSNGTIRKILSTYEKKTTYLKIGVEQIPISEELIRLIFGIVDGDKEIKVGKKERVRVAFIDRLYPLTKTKKDNKLTKSKIEMVLKSKGISSEDFARLAVLYILTYALAPTKGYSIGWYYTQFVEDVNSMIKYNWSSFIYDMLMVGLDKEKRGSMGCVLILAYCLCECSRIIDPLPRSPTFPRCVKWDLNELAKALKGKDIDFFFHKVRVYTKATKEEKRLLLRIEEDKENDENVNGSMKMTHASQEEIERLRVMVEEQKKLIEEQNHEIEKLKKDLESSTKRQEELMLEDGNKNEPFKAGGVHEHLEDFVIVERARENNHAEMSSVPITEAGDHDQRDDSMNRKRGRTNEQNLQAELPQSKKSFIDAGEQSDDSMRTKRAKQSEQQQDYTEKMEAIDGCEIGKIKITYKRQLRKRSRTDTNGPNENGTNEEVEPCSKSKCNGETVVGQRELLWSMKVWNLGRKEFGRNC